MSEVRCAHCGRLHGAGTRVCPTTALPIEPRRSRRSASEQAAADAEIGRVIDDKYRILGRLGAGGMSTVFEAEPVDDAPASRVAVKVLRPALADDPEATARLRREAVLVQSIRHPNICAILDLGRTSDGRPYLVMERLFGESLAQLIRRGPLAFGEIEPILQQILAALGAAHEIGVLHRDLKPENIFIEDRAFGEPARAKLLDFGVAKSIAGGPAETRLTDTGMVMGTPYYMAPEQARGDVQLDQRVDLWAVGVILYEALSGRRPFSASNYNALLVKILSARPKPLGALVPGLSEAVGAVVERALANEREKRFATARELSLALAACRSAGDDRPEPTQRLAAKRPARGQAKTRAEPAHHYRRRTEGELDPLGDRRSGYEPDEPEPTVRERSRDGEADTLREPTRAQQGEDDEHDAADTIVRKR